MEAAKEAKLAREISRVKKATTIKEYPGKQENGKLYFFRGFTYTKDRRRRRNLELCPILRCSKQRLYGCNASKRLISSTSDVVAEPDAPAFPSHICEVEDFLYERKFEFRQALNLEARDTLRPLRKIFDDLGKDDGE